MPRGDSGDALSDRVLFIGKPGIMTIRDKEKIGSCSLFARKKNGADRIFV